MSGPAWTPAPPGPPQLGPPPGTFPGGPAQTHPHQPRPGAPIPPGQPFPGYPGQAPTPSRRLNKRTAWALGIAAFLVLAVFCGAAVVLIGGTTRGLDRRSAAARAETSRSAAVANELAGAATVLGETPAVRYKGTLITDDGDPMPVEAGITSEGVTDATLTIGPEPVGVVVVGGETYVKAGGAFWQTVGASTDVAAEYGQQWVKTDPDALGFDLNVLAPGAIARLLDPGDGVVHPQVGEPTMVNGVEARPMRVGELTAHVTTGKPRRVVRIATGDGAAPSPGASLRTSRLRDGPRFLPARAPAGAGFEVDVMELTDPQLDEFFQILEGRLAGLKDALDSHVRFSVTGEITLAPCSTKGCQANVTVSNQVDAGSPYAKAQRPVNATVTIAMTLDGRPVANCVNAISMPPNGTGSTSCRAAYAIPPSRNPKSHEVRATSRVVARALVQADVDRLVADLHDGRDRTRPVPRPPKNAPTVSPGASPRAGAPGSPSPSPAVSPSDPAKACRTPFYDLQGDQHTRNGHFTGGSNYDPRVKSRWDDTVDLQSMVQLAGYFKPVLQPNGRCAWNGSAGSTIGYLSRTQQRTSEFTVITLLNGKLWTMYPGPII